MPAGLLDRLRELPHAEPVLDAVAPEAGVHVVGGAVRDVLLGLRPVELDLVVEGDPAVVAHRVAQRLGGDVRLHPRFGTATVHGRGVAFDLAAARRERYPRPGGLPEVELGASLAEDLERRDFTVNAVAVSAHDGRLTAHPLAVTDLTARRLRALHAGSFHDDPTRLLRLCRYAARLGFLVDYETSELVEDAVSARVVETVSGERLGRELRRLLREPQPAALLAVAAHGLGPQVLHPAFALDSELMRRALELCPDDGRRDLLALAATAMSVPAAKLAVRLDALGFDRRERELIVAVATRSRPLAERLGRPGGGAAPWPALAVEAPETVALAGAVAPAHMALARHWLSDLRHLDTLVSGRDLQAAGLQGPAIGRGLRAARAALWDGRAPDFERQLAAALEATGSEGSRGDRG